jgi:MATE family multidrug resistance protein
VGRGELLRTAFPLILGFAGTQLMSVVDTAMVGRLGAEDLSGVSIGGGLFMVGTIFGLGCVLGMDPLVTQAVGGNEQARARRVLRDGLRVATWVSLPIMMLVLLATLSLSWFGVPRGVADAAGMYVVGRLGGILPFLLFSAQRSYLQAHGAGRPIVWAMVMANVVNLAANAVLIFGDAGIEAVGLPAIGMPPLGVLGAGLASTLAGVASLAVGGLGARALSHGHAAAGDAPPLARRILQLGVPIGLTLLAEVGAFALTSVLAGRIGAVSGAGHQVAITIASFSFTVTLGIGAATTVLVGRAVGRGDTPGARAAGFAGLRASTVFMALSAVTFVMFAEPLSRALSTQAEVVEAAVPLVYLAALFQISDGAQAVAAGALRGVGDTKYIQHVNVVGHYLIGLPVAVTLGFGAELGARGLWAGLCAGLSAVAGALILRFHRLSSRALARV